MIMMLMLASEEVLRPKSISHEGVVGIPVERQ
jgi:hypothetical protein